MTTHVGVCIPWRPQPTRVRHLNPVIDRIMEQLQQTDAEAYTVDSGHEVFNRSASFNGAVRLAEVDGCDVVVLTGADLLLYGDLAGTVERTAADGRSRIAYTDYLGLTATGTEHWYANNAWSPERAMDRREVAYATDGACAGFVVMTVAEYWHIGGHDEDYLGWGYEDVDFAVRAQFERRPGTCVALWHAEDADKHTHIESNAARFHDQHPGA